MKVNFETEDIETIAQRVAEMLTPIISDNKKSQDQDIIYDVPKLAEYLKVSAKWVYERTHLNEIPHIKRKGFLRFRKKDIDRWLAGYNIPAVDTPDRILKAIK